MALSTLRNRSLKRLDQKANFRLINALLQSKGDPGAIQAAVAGMSRSDVANACEVLFIQRRDNAALLLRIAQVTRSVAAARLAINEILDNPQYFPNEVVTSAAQANTEFQVLPSVRW